MNITTELWIGIRSMLYLYDRMLKTVCAEYNLTLAEAEVVSFLQNNPGKDTATDIVELRRLSKGTVSKAVEDLIQKSLLERIPDTEDRRRIHLKLGPEAKPITEMIDKVRKEFFDIILKGITEEELELHGRFLGRMFHNTKIAMEREDREWDSQRRMK